MGKTLKYKIFLRSNFLFPPVLLDFWVNNLYKCRLSLEGNLNHFREIPNISSFLQRSSQVRYSLNFGVLLCFCSSFKFWMNCNDFRGSFWVFLERIGLKLSDILKYMHYSAKTISLQRFKCQRRIYDPAKCLWGSVFTKTVNGFLHRISNRSVWRNSKYVFFKTSEAIFAK